MRKFVGTVALAVTALAVAPGVSSASIGLSFEGNAGTHPEGGVVNSFSWGVSNSGGGGKSGGGAGKVRLQDIHLTKPVDRSSPLYANQTATGRHLKKAQIYFDQPGSADGLALCMEDVAITKYAINDVRNGSGDQDQLEESLTLSYSKVSYVIYLDGGPLTATFDLKRYQFGITTSNPCPTAT